MLTLSDVQEHRAHKPKQPLMQQEVLPLTHSLVRTKPTMQAHTLYLPRFQSF